MGRRGPSPTPKTILEARGSWRANRPENEEPGEMHEPKKPDWLDDESSSEWDCVMGDIRQLGVARQVSSHFLARYCVSRVRWRKNNEFLQKHGEFYPIKDAEGKTKCLMPWPQAVANKAISAELLKMEQEVGLTPSSRRRVNIDESQSSSKSGKSRFFPGPRLANSA